MFSDILQFLLCFALVIAWRMVWLSMTDFCNAACASFRLDVPAGGVSFCLDDFAAKFGDNCVHLLELLVLEGQLIYEPILFAFRAGTAGWCGVEVGRFGDYAVPHCGQHFPRRPLPRRLGCSPCCGTARRRVRRRG